MKTMQLLMVKSYFGWLSFWNSSKAAEVGFKVFQKVRKKSIREREQPFFENAEHFTLPYKDRHLDCYEMGNQEHEPVILVHGWESNAGCMSQIAEKLVAKNKRVITFNLPGHAFDSYDYSNLVECSEALKIVYDWVNPNQPISFIAHSFGSAVTGFTIDKHNIQADNLVFLTTPNKIEEVFDDFKSLVGLSSKAYNKLKEITQRKLGEKVEHVSVEDQIARAEFNRLLLMHDEDDSVIPFKNSAAIHRKNKNSQLIPFKKVGHYKMLWNDEISTRAVSFALGNEIVG